MSPIAWAIRPLKRYAEFSGRSPRAEYWWFILFMSIFYVVVMFGLFGSANALSFASGDPSAAVAGGLGIAALFIGLFWLAVFIPTIAVQVRRMHDLDRSGWWIGGFYLIYLLYAVASFGLIGAAAASGDAEPSGALALVALSGIIGLAFLIYTIVLLVFFCMPGTKGANRYGPDPYGEDVAQVFA